MNSWALYQRNGNLLVGKLISAGVRTFATIERIGMERVNRVHVIGVFDTEDAAYRARDAAREAIDPLAAKTAVKAVQGYRPLA